MDFPLTDANFLMYAAQHYAGYPGHTTDDDLFEDLSRIRYVKKLLNRYVESGDLKERLILNHLIVLSNVFGAEPAVRMLHLKLHSQFHLLLPFLRVINILPKVINGDPVSEMIFDPAVTAKISGVLPT